MTQDTTALHAPTSTARAIGNTLKGSLGNLIEWYDVYAYSVFQTYFKDQFFAPEDENADIYIWAGFALTFLARPLGAWFFGRFADRHGRKASLTLSVTIMAIGSLAIALLPTRVDIGVWAAVLLMFIRLVQGFATGGEYAASATYMSEAATANRRGFFSSFQYVTLVGGHVLAQLTLLLLTAFMSKPELEAWGWRIPFFIGALGALIVFWLRKTMDESLSSEYLEKVRTGVITQTGTVKELFLHYWKPLLVCFLFTFGGTVAFYTYSVNGPAVIKATFKETDPMLANWINLASLTFFMLIQPIGGLISDKIGRKPVFLFFGVLGVAWTWVVLTFLPQQQNGWMAFLMICVSYVILTGYTSINAIFKAELFPAHVRALAVGLGYGLANSIFGGTSPMIYQLAKANGATVWFTVYVTFCIAVTLVTTLVVMRNKGETHLDVEQGRAYES
ncbi:MFS transporter [Pseudoclavibacter alba]|uniref:MFS transporter n=1 Tax=Pseudoclavibacter albus TaxID=272241 RepID=A0ABT2HXG2_9MICO|nr:MFS transporter [Pseudoclavibacter alba]MBN6778748.1 MFS transporter [Pseudoclavibacter alba]MCT2043007.1 MFS transporter [Pseudoclavibacter alba]